MLILKTVIQFKKNESNVYDISDIICDKMIIKFNMMRKRHALNTGEGCSEPMYINMVWKLLLASTHCDYKAND